MTAVTTEVGSETNAALSAQQLAMLFQYTVEAYKVFQKLAENLPNPMTRAMFAQFAVDEREDRDLIDMKAAATGQQRRPPSPRLGPDLQRHLEVRCRIASRGVPRSRERDAAATSCAK